ncbi:soluble lytic murein transglycosylase [Methylobacterium sp. PvP062]|uniref:Lytic transglycosylase catalytic n=2 Tax=Methylobacterium radiotolerans TaxID=31998 RepID=B1LTD8_METRJ|nr:MULTISPECIES: lytic transglycosylase domain-containing protein [Methylobacterium]MCX7331476.1 transglycosylase SLT domain-containing protein [Hyphomicrobiales bacterium]ACB23884.1 Lytic transglycosylase catalytic [Methylobacterium radiotolerans JCM 2831]KZC03726.1 Soluble lytic murein transglycosylase [Methylobacterium radiotolerans]MBP2494464.1 soluble lytic murein transglycosylase [Methylobacterium sp. PvP105]MBP2499162.1 soluble lytic murein transglycosylase [Methylobacterium sp. PvP109]
MIRPAASSPASKRTSLTAAALVATVGVALAGQVGTDAPTAAALAAPASQPSSQPASQPTPPASDAALSTAQVRGAQAAKAADPVAADALKLDPVHASGGDDKGEEPARTLPAAASAYASADPDAPVAFPLPDAAVTPAAPVPEVPDPARPKISGDTDPTLLRGAIDLYRKGRVADGDRMRDGFTDPAARALLEWVAIRAGAGIGFNRTVAFVRANPDWPAGPLLRRRAEEALLSERKSPAVVRAYFATAKPSSAPGKFALALALRADGCEADAAEMVRDLWRTESFGRSLEAKVLDAFPDALTRVDHRYRMERALLKDDWESAGRAAGYAGGGYASLVRARRAVEDKSSGAAAALAAVPPSLRGDASYIFSRAQYLRRADKPEAAAAVLATAPSNPDVLVDGDEWWIERRIVARKLLDLGDAKTAYAVASQPAARSPEKRIEAEFHAGWIALRFAGDPAAAAQHFAQVAAIAESPISVARAAYWQGRAAEALGQSEEAKRFYERAALQPIAYYGQVARARLGQTSLPLRAPADLEGAERQAFDGRLSIRALRLLGEAGIKELALPLYIDAARDLSDPRELQALGDLATDMKDARALVAIGKLAVQRGLPLDAHAYPTIGIPSYETFTAVPQVERAMVYAIARQESQFDPRAQSGVGARGLMQMMPATAQRTARRVSTAFDVDRLTSDPAYCAKLGQAHLGELMEDWRGSYVLAFASYNAGGGNVKKWIDAYGDPRKGDVDVIDWVERIPFTETRNYVQRVMENLQVYRSRLDSRSALLIEGDLHRGAR